jgi:sensor histidine kinase regulating citrate/malate metabolism
MILWGIGLIIALVALTLQFENIKQWIQNNFPIFIVFLLLTILVTLIVVLFLVFMVH